MSATWTIGELTERAAHLLRAQSARVDETSARTPAATPNGRIREVPNERLIRWYATIGLMDPPLARRGRVALYGHRHLLQLVAVKRLQAEGRSIAEIQTLLTGATDDRLRSAARLPDSATARQAAAGAPAATAATDGDADVQPVRARFWTAPAGPPSTAAVTEAAADDVPRPVAASPPADPVFVPGVRLAPGVTVVLDGADRAPTADDLAALTTAAGPLLAALRERGLIAPPTAPIARTEPDSSTAQGSAT